MFNDAYQLPSGQVIIAFHTYCSIIGHSIIRRSIKCRVCFDLSIKYRFSLCLSMFCRTGKLFTPLK